MNDPKRVSEAMERLGSARLALREAAGLLEQEAPVSLTRAGILEARKDLGELHEALLSYYEAGWGPEEEGEEEE